MGFFRKPCFAFSCHHGNSKTNDSFGIVKVFKCLATDFLKLTSYSGFIGFSPVTKGSVPMAYLSLNVNFKQFAHKLLI